MFEIIDNKEVKARKDHVCDWCRGTIKKGEVYDKQTCKNDGDIYTWKTHLKCLDICGKLQMFDIDDSIDSDQFMQSVYGFLYRNLSEEEHDGLIGEAAVDMALKILGN